MKQVVSVAVALIVGAVAFFGQGGDGEDLIDWGSVIGGESQQGPVAVPTGKAATALEELVVKGPAPMTGYDRDEFGPAWSDDVTVRLGRDGCDTRNGVLKESLSDVVIEPGTNGCVVTSGVLEKDPYSGKTIVYDGGGEELHLEHIVALGAAWRTGAQQMSAQQRQNLANDPLNLMPVDASLNMSKGDANIATWQPPNKSYRCDYATRQIAVKAKYDLWVVPAEKQTMATILSACPGQALPTPQEQK